MISNERKSYDEGTTNQAINLIRAIRPTFRLKSNMFDGARFKDDNYVLSVLETTSEQWEFEDFPTTTVGFALEQAARSDYWYKNEKQYGNEYEGEDAEESNDDE